MGLSGHIPALGGSLTNINFRDASGSDGKLLSVRPMLFASYRYEDFHIDVAGGYAYHDLQITRYMPSEPHLEILPK